MDVLPTAIRAVAVMAGVAPVGAAGGAAQFAETLDEALVTHCVGQIEEVSQSPPVVFDVRLQEGRSDPVVTALKATLQTQSSENSPCSDAEQAIVPHQFDIEAIAVELNLAPPATPQPLAAESPSQGTAPALKPLMQQPTSRLRVEESQPEDSPLSNRNRPTLPEVGRQGSPAVPPGPATMPHVPAGPPRKDGAQAPSPPTRSPSESRRDDSVAVSEEPSLASPATPQPLADVSPSQGMAPALKPPMQQRTGRLRAEVAQPEDLPLSNRNSPTLPEVGRQAPPVAPQGLATSPAVQAGQPQKDVAQAASPPARSPSQSRQDDSAAVPFNEKSQALQNSHTVIRTAAAPYSQIEDTPRDDSSSALATQSFEQPKPDIPQGPSPGRDHHTLGRVEELVRPPALQVSRQVQASIPLAHLERPTATHAVIRLNPPELGAVRIQVERPKEGGAAVTLTVERPETLLLLLRDREGLSQALDRAGIPPDGRVVTYQAASPVNPIDAPRNDTDLGQTHDRPLGQGGGHGSGQGQGGQRGWAGADHPGFELTGADASPVARFLTLTDRIDITA